jgi:hypothetical protein
MLAVWDAWMDFHGLTVNGPLFHSQEALAVARTKHPDLTEPRELDHFVEFATQEGGLTMQQAEAMFWKDWFWLVRQGIVKY